METAVVLINEMYRLLNQSQYITMPLLALIVMTVLLVTVLKLLLITLDSVRDYSITIRLTIKARFSRFAHTLLGYMR